MARMSAGKAAGQKMVEGIVNQVRPLLEAHIVEETATAFLICVVGADRAVETSIIVRSTNAMPAEKATQLSREISLDLHTMSVEVNSRLAKTIIQRTTK